MGKDRHYPPDGSGRGAWSSTGKDLTRHERRYSRSRSPEPPDRRRDDRDYDYRDLHESHRNSSSARGADSKHRSERSRLDYASRGYRGLDVLSTSREMISQADKQGGSHHSTDSGFDSFSRHEDRQTRQKENRGRSDAREWDKRRRSQSQSRPQSLEVDRAKHDHIDSRGRPPRRSSSVSSSSDSSPSDSETSDDSRRPSKRRRHRSRSPSVEHKRRHPSKRKDKGKMKDKDKSRERSASRERRKRRKEKKDKDKIERRSALTGKKIKLKVKKDKGDHERDANRKDLLQFLNSTFE